MKKLGETMKKSSQFNKVALLVFALVIGVTGYVILNRSHAATTTVPNPPTVYLSPTTQTLAVNTTFTVQVRENSGTTGVNAVEADFSYPANLLTFVSIDTTGTAFPTVGQATGGAGQVSIGLGQGGGSTAATGDQFVANVTFTTKTTGGTVALAFTTNTELDSATTFSNILPSLSSTGGSTYIIDATNPSVSVAAPTNGSSISYGSTSTITANASDDSGTLTGVDILVDGAVKVTDTSSPYTYNWNTTGVTLGNHTIQAIAHDPYGNNASSTIVTVNVADLTAPTVSITAPTAGSTLAGTTSINATAADTGGTSVTKVEFYVDGVLKNTDTATPYSYSWDTKTATDGSHSLTAKAYDGATPANVTTSTPVINVTVDNADHTAPTTPGTLHTTSVGLNNVTLAWTASTDNIGVTGYRISRNGTVLTTTAALTYADTGLASGTSYAYTVVALDAASNPSPAATLSVSTIAVRKGDLTGDGKVGPPDLAILLGKWGTADATADINHNGSVDIGDLSALLGNWLP